MIYIVPLYSYVLLYYPKMKLARELFNESQYVDSHVGETMRRAYAYFNIWNHFVVFLIRFLTLLLPNGYRLSVLVKSIYYTLPIRI